MRSPNQWLEAIAPRVSTIWRGAWPPGRIEPERYLFDHELVIVTAGSCRVRVGAEVHDIRAGDFLIVPPARRHATVAGCAGVHRSCLHFDWTFRAPRPAGSPYWIYPPRRPRAAQTRKAPSFVPRGVLSGRFPAGGPVLPLIETLFHRWEAEEDQERATCHALLGELLVRLFWRGNRPERRGDRATQLAYRVKELLDNEAAARKSINELLGSLHLSYAHLCRLFTARFGISPVRYRNAVRLERARHLLRDFHRSVAESGRAAGFDDAAYFSRKFRQVYGTTPALWRASAEAGRAARR